MEALENWLYEQAPVVVVMGLVIFYLTKKLNEKDKELTRLSAKFQEMAQEIFDIFKGKKD